MRNTWTNSSGHWPRLLRWTALFLTPACQDTGSLTRDEPIAVAGQALSATYTVTFQDGVDGYSGTADTYLSQAQPSTNYGASNEFTVDGDEPSGTSQDTSALLRWEISTIPSDAIVVSASIGIQVTNASSNSYPILGLSRAFSESNATWMSATTGVDWELSGAQGSTDCNSTSLGTVSASSTGTHSVSLNTAGIAKVQAWVSNPSENYGIIIASASNTDGLDFCSSEHATVAYRPKLTINYRLPDTAGTGGASSGTGGTSATGGSLAHGSAAAVGGTFAAGGSIAHGSAAAVGGTATTGGTSAGRTSTGGTPANGGSSTGGSAGSIGFFVFSDSHVTSNRSLFGTAIPQMSAIDAAPLAGISVGDFTNNATASEWSYHTQLARNLFDPAATVFGGTRRYLGIPGNHDTSSGSWYTYWTANLPGQTNLGHSGSDGIYFTTEYANVLFAAVDSNAASGPSTSWSDPQTVALGEALRNSSAQFKFLFFHKPVYSCNTTHAGYASGLPWIDLAERYGVDIVFSGHTHVYTRTCELNRGTCVADGSGTIQVELGSASGTPRSVNVANASVSGTDSTGAARTDNYNCTTNLAASRGSANSFCHVGVNGCQATLRCYTVGAGNTTPFDTLTINHCGG